MIINYNAHKPYSKDSIYHDVLSHCKKPYLSNSRYTSVHEATHQIASDIRRKYPAGINAFYLLQDNAILLKEPPTTISAAAPMVPKNLRGFRYDLYFVKQTKYWDEHPLYIMEEWNCYINGGLCAMEDYRNKRELERTDAVAGMFEFQIYSLVMAKHIKETCPEYWDAHGKELSFFIWTLCGRSDISFTIGRSVEQFQSSMSDKLYAEYVSSEEGRMLNDFKKSLIEVEWTISSVF